MSAFVNVFSNQKNNNYVSNYKATVTVPKTKITERKEKPKVTAKVETVEEKQETKTEIKADTNTNLLFNGLTEKQVVDAIAKDTGIQFEYDNRLKKYKYETARGKFKITLHLSQYSCDGYNGSFKEGDVFISCSYTDTREGYSGSSAPCNDIGKANKCVMRFLEILKVETETKKAERNQQSDDDYVFNYTRKRLLKAVAYIVKNGEKRNCKMYFKDDNFEYFTDGIQIIRVPIEFGYSLAEEFNELKNYESLPEVFDANRCKYESEKHYAELDMFADELKSSEKRTRETGIKRINKNLMYFQIDNAVTVNAYHLQNMLLATGDSPIEYTKKNEAIYACGSCCDYLLLPINTVPREEVINKAFYVA